MPMPKLPAAKADLVGASIKNPQRYRVRAPADNRGVGDPPEWLTELETEIFVKLASVAPWLRPSDNTFLANAARLQAQLQADPEPRAAIYAAMTSMFSKLGLTPVDVDKVAGQREDEENPLAEFLNN